MSGRARLAAASALLLGVACAPPPAAQLEDLLPDALRLAGWEIVEGPVSHGPDRLFEYLDGGAERYLGYGFRELVHLRSQLGEDPLACVTLDLYDMGGPAGAFGIFRSALPPDAAPRPWCTEGYSSGTVAAAWRGSLYVHGEADDGRPELTAILSAFIEQVCDRAPGEDALPAFLEPLPAEGLVPQSERWFAADLLGHAFLPGGVTASYRIDGREVRLYYSELGSEETAAQALARLRGEWARRSPVNDLPAPGRGGFRYTSAGVGSGSAVAAGRFVAGVHCDAPDSSPDDRQRLLAALVNGLAAR